MKITEPIHGVRTLQSIIPLVLTLPLCVMCTGLGVRNLPVNNDNVPNF